MDNRQEVREFLTTRRARITPDQVGLPTTGSRRVPGLRRSEVASLAGLSVEYYARLERGQIAGASAGVLDALARALQLDETERAHLLDLARAADGIPTSGRPRRRTASKAASRLSLQWALEAITDGVAFVRDPHQNLLATNALGRAFYSPVIGDGGRLPNLARFQFLDPASRDFYPDWELFAEMCVGIMRTEAGRDPHDRGLQDLVGELSTRSETFRRLWADHNVRTHGSRHQTVPPPRRRRADPRLRGARHHRRTRPRAPRLHRRTRLALRRTPPPARLLGSTRGPVPRQPVHEHSRRNLMQITRSSIDTAKGPADWFTGDVYIDSVAAAPPPSRVTANLVHFMPGARTHWHRHPLSQTVFVTEGVGLCQRRGGPVEVIRPGDRVLFEADEEHWHGAAPNRLMVHLAINEGDDQHDVVHWLQPVTDDEYPAAPTHDA